MRFPSAAETAYGEVFELSTHLLAIEMLRRGASLQWLRNALFVATLNGHRYAWNQTKCLVTSTIGAELAGRKDYTRQLLRDACVAVADGGSFRIDQYQQALARTEAIGWPVVVKPVGGRKGRGVTVGVDNPDGFAAAWQAASVGPRIVVERQVFGTEARFLVVGGSVVAVAGRVLANVTGDGRSTIRELIDAKNRLRSQNPHLATRLIPYHEDIGLERVPELGEYVIVDHRGGFSTGADSVDLTDDVHPSYLAVAARAEQALPGLGLAGVDIIAMDYRQPATPDNYIVVEVNSRPAIGAHHFPWNGKPRDVAASIVAACLASRGLGQAAEGIDDDRSRPAGHPWPDSASCPADPRPAGGGLA